MTKTVKSSDNTVASDRTSIALSEEKRRGAFWWCQYVVEFLDRGHSAALYKTRIALAK